MEILQEHSNGCLLNQAHIDAFAAEGVPALSLAKTWCCEYSWVYRDRVAFIGESRFEFARFAKRDDGVGAFTFVCLDESGTPADIAAWRPPRFALWLGRVSILGEEQAYAPRLGEPLHVHDSVMSWFRAAREGIFVVDHAGAAALLQNETLAVETDAEARQLRRRLTRPAPPIHVIRRHRDDERAAA